MLGHHLRCWSNKTISEISRTRAPHSADGMSVGTAAGSERCQANNLNAGQTSKRSRNSTFQHGASTTMPFCWLWDVKQAALAVVQPLLLTIINDVCPTPRRLRTNASHILLGTSNRLRKSWCEILTVMHTTKSGKTEHPFWCDQNYVWYITA